MEFIKLLEPTDDSKKLAELMRFNENTSFRVFSILEKVKFH